MNLFRINSSDSRNFGLDLLRFLAILSVLINHSFTVLPDQFHSKIWFFIDGVLLFFVLSGYLIGRIFIRDFSDSFTFEKMKEFWTRRWFRTLPAYYFTIFLLLIVFVLSREPMNGSSIFQSFFFIQNFSFHTGAFFPESWSLAIEEWFYLLLPITCFLINKILKVNIKNNVLLCALLVIALSIIMRYLKFINTEIWEVFSWDKNFRSVVIYRLDSIMIGVLTAWIYTYKRNLFDNYKLLFFITGLLIFSLDKILIFFDFFSFNTSAYLSVWFFLVNSISIGLMIPFFYTLKKPSSQFVYRVVTIGSLISYSMYLVNLTLVSRLLVSPLHINYLLKYMLFWGLTIMISIIMYKYIEVPFMNLRDGIKNNKKIQSA